MNEQQTLQTVLRKKFLDLQAKNKNFSMRALAKRLDMQPSATNEILKGERKVSRKLAEKISERLKLDPTERNELLKDFPEKMRRRSKYVQNKNGQELEAMKLTSEQYACISEWIHFAIISLMKTPEFKHDPQWIAERFGVKESEVVKAIDRMLKLNLIMKEDGILIRTSSRLNTTDDVLNIFLQKAHMADMDIAKVKISSIPVEERDFSSLTFNGNPKHLAKAKEILRKAQDDLEELMDDGDGLEVYKVCTYLFPLTTKKH
ncbi:MAG: TIGR02147 family protein [Bacteriovoracaceae bacterium]